MIERTNGKLYITGEYQVLNKKGIAVIYGIPRYIHFEIKPNDSFKYISKTNEESFTYIDKVLTFNNDNLVLQSSFMVAFKYLELNKIDIKPFEILVNTELEDKSGSKYGFGSSSAIISGIIKTILNYYELNVNNLTIFKLSVLAQIHANEVSSGGDLAASIYANKVYYRRYNEKWVIKHKDNIKIVNKKWPHLVLLPFKTNILFGAVWTKTSYKTKPLSKSINKEDLKTARNLVKKSYKELVTNDYLEFKKTMKSYQSWFEDVLKEENIITPEIKTAINILNKFMLTSKISGAGGGDSVIFVYPKNYNFESLKKALTKSNLELILFEVENDK